MDNQAIEASAASNLHKEDMWIATQED